MNTPPRWSEWLLERLLKDRFVDESIGDLYEWYELQSHANQSSQSRWALWKYLLYSLRPYKLKSIQKLLLLMMDHSLLSNNIKMGVRSLIKHSQFTAINLVGLTTAFTAAVLIFAYVSFERSYDNFHPKGDQVYRILTQDLVTGELGRPTPTPLAPAFLSEYDEMIEFARFGNDEVYVDIDGKKFYEAQFYWGDSSLFDIFHLPFLYGNQRTALREPNTVVLTEEVSEKYFGAGVDPTGRTLPIKVLDSDTDLSVRIDGVMKALPTNTDLPFEVIGSLVTGLDLYKQFGKSWGFNWLHTYAHVPQPTDLPKLESAVPDLIEKNLGERFKTLIGLKFQPLAEVHLRSQYIRRSNYGDSQQVMIFIVIGGFLLLIATVNFINLSASRISKRLKEISVRHVNGASRRQLVQQFLIEFLLTTFFSLAAGAVLVLVLWEPFCDFVGKEIPMSVLSTWPAYLLIAGMLLIPSLLAASFPSLLMARIKPTELIKGQERSKGRKGLRLGLVGFQFALTSFLILCTIVVFQQFQRLSDASLGFDPEQLVSIKVEDRDLQRQLDLLKSEMAKVHGVKAIASSSETLPSEMNNTWGYYWDENSEDQNHVIDIVGLDQDYFPTVGIDIIEGSNFNLPFRSDSARSVILNQTAASLIGAEALGSLVKIGGTDRRVIGIAEDHHYRSLKSPIEPVAYMVYGPGYRVSPDNLVVKMSIAEASRTIQQLSDTWETIGSETIFDFHFVDEAFQEAYESEASFIQLFGIFTSLSIIISCIGLFGIVIFLSSEKQKEVSIRKVMGSSSWQLTGFMLRELSITIGIGIAVAIPFAVWSLDRWLAQFVFRVDIELYVILLAIALTTVLALVTMGGNVLQVVRSNPTKYLRNE